MKKDRRLRYNSAAELASDIQHFLNNEPVVASPPSLLYRISKFVSKNRLTAAAVVAIPVALCVGFGTSTFLYVRDERNRQEAVTRVLSRERAAESLVDQVKIALQQG